MLTNNRNRDQYMPIYIVDTCVLASDSNFLSHFKNSKIIIPSVVLEELDNLKTKMTLSGKNSRLIIKRLYEFCRDGLPKAGLSICNGNTLFIDSEVNVNSKFNCNNNDDKILACAAKYETGIMLSRDANLLLRAIAAGLKTEFYESQGGSESEIYSGYKEMLDLDFEGLTNEGVDTVIGTPFEDLYPNEFVKVNCNGKFILYRRHSDNSLKPVRIPNNVYGVRSKNAQQAMAFDLLLDPNISLVTIAGSAGTGKTYLAMAMAVSYLLEKKVQRIILARPAVEAGERLGFLPGDLAEKVNPYLRPLYDALYDMIDLERAAALINKGLIEVAPLAFMRGRTLNDSFVILDEAQNTTSEQMKMFLTRLGFGSKAIITGDITQVDLPQERVSGLIEAEHILNKIARIRFVHFSEIDVVRHPLVQDVIKAYARLDKERKANFKKINL